MKALVVGGAGFIGSNLVDQLIANGDTVHVVDDLSTGKESYVNNKAILLKSDIATDSAGLQYYYQNENFDVVFHLAAWPRVVRSIEDTIGTHRVNVDGTLNILELCRRLKIKRLVYSSSSSVYGDQKSPIMKEYFNKVPKSPYALQKLIGEQYGEMYASLFGVEVIALRYFNVYGLRQATEGAYSLVIGKFLEQKKKGEKLTVYGDGKQTRAYTHVSDVVRANILASNFDIKKYNFWNFNIGTNKETSVNDIAAMIGGEVQHIIPNPRGDFEENRKCADYSKAEIFMGWKPTVTIEEGIKALL